MNKIESLIESFLKKNKENDNILLPSEIDTLVKKWLSTVVIKLNFEIWEKIIPLNEVKFGLSKSNYCLLFSKQKVCINFSSGFSVVSRYETISKNSLIIKLLSDDKDTEEFISSIKSMNLESNMDLNESINQFIDDYRNNQFLITKENFNRKVSKKSVDVIKKIFPNGKFNIGILLPCTVFGEYSGKHEQLIILGLDSLCFFSTNSLHYFHFRNDDQKLDLFLNGCDGLKFNLNEIHKLEVLSEKKRYLGESFKITINENKILEFSDDDENKWSNKFKITYKNIEFLIYEFVIRFSSHFKDLTNSRLKSERINLMRSQTKIINQLDSDGNGIIDEIEGDNEFMKLLKIHQQKIIDFDKSYVQKFVKIDQYLESKRENIQNIFLNIKKVESTKILNEHVGLLRNQVHTYNLILVNSMKMLISVIEEDLITFYEIYESFDKVNLFNSNWENEVSKKLDDIGKGLNQLMISIHEMEISMVKGLNEINRSTQKLNQSINKELGKINSLMKFNNLISSIGKYNIYKPNYEIMYENIT